MAKDREEKKSKKDKKEKKDKRSEVDGVTKAKKEKKHRKSEAENGDADTSPLELALEKQSSPARDAAGDVEMTSGDKSFVLVDALVPFANPLATDAKELKKILRTVKKSAKAKTLRRGVKEVVKALRKSSTSDPSSSGTKDPAAITIIAADISPMDVISHIPVLCEDHNIPYIYVKSRAELGDASATKRPTSVVMVAKERAGKKSKDVKEEDTKEFSEAYGDLVKLVNKAAESVRK